MSAQEEIYYLAIDQGGHASRAIVFNQQGELISQTETAISTNTPQPDWVEHDPVEMIDSVQQAIAKVIQQLGDKSRFIKAAGLATQRSSIACWDKNTGKPLSPIISWQDRRNAAWLEQLNSKQAFIHQRTGLMLSPHYGGSKIRWCLDHLPQVQEALKEERLVIGPMASYLAFHLLNEKPLIADPANASRTQLWNLETKNWDQELLGLYQVPRQTLPQCTNSFQHFGNIEIEGMNIPLTVITGDQSAALFAGGKPNHDTTYINMGTGAFIQRPTPKPMETEKLLSGVVFVDQEQGFFTIEGTVNGAARALQWFAQKEGISNLELSLAQWMDETDNPPLFLNGIAGLAAPYWVADFESQFIGKGDQKAKAVAVTESIAFLLFRNLEETQRYLPNSSQLVVTGGLAQLTPLCQRLADLSLQPVIRPKESEATARGLAFLVANQPADWPAGENETIFPRKNNALLERYIDWKAKLEMKLSET